MNIRLAGLVSLAVILLPANWGWLGAAPAMAQAPAAAAAGTEAEGAWSKDLAAWRAQREHELAAPDGWLTLVGLEWLKPGFNSFGAAADNQIRIRAKAPDHIGLFTVSGMTGSGKPASTKATTGGQAPAGKAIIQLLAPAGGFPPDLTIDGQPAREGPLAIDSKPSTIVWHGLTMAVLERGDRFALRIKDADSPTRTGFHGLNWYAPDPRFRVTARWIPFNPPHIERIPTVIGTTLDLPAPGIAEFTLDGKTLQLEPVIEAGEADTLFFILRDQTSHTTTYGAARFLHTGLPDHGLGQPGELTLDFNRLENPPCAYTPYATCPLPPEQNRLPVALEAGEQRYEH
ncbi:MAG: DUF1684 domain-containing protein [Terracidiphilus sp.]|jgi:uncharacterized protein (DUF1684 family)